MSDLLVHRSVFSAYGVRHQQRKIWRSHFFVLRNILSTAAILLHVLHYKCYGYRHEAKLQ